MNITLSPLLESKLTPESVALSLAIGLYSSGEVTLGHAAAVAHLNQTQFMHELGRRRIPMNYGTEDLAQDLETVEKLSVCTTRCSTFSAAAN